MKRQYVKIYCCGDCVHYNWKKHCCSRGAKKETSPRDHFYSDCPLGVCEEDIDEKQNDMVQLPLAISALEKQIPKKIKWQLRKEYCPSDAWYPDYGHEDTWNEKEGYWLEEHALCPVCEKDFGSMVIGRINYCSHCGQALDWSEEDMEDKKNETMS